MDGISFYPKLTENLMDACGFLCGKYKFYYTYQGETRALDQSGSNIVKLSDSHEWKIETDGLSFSKEISIVYPNLLYGSGGIACSAAVIGICILWTNKTLTQTGCILPSSDNTTCMGRHVVFNHTFDPGTIRGDLELSIVLYLKEKAKHTTDEEARFNNEEGVVIGEVETIYLDFNSIYMEFPIEDCYSPDLPLWWLKLSNWDDPKIDLFSKENVCIMLNTFYPDCPMIKDKITSIDLLIDILATSYLLIFEKIKEKGDLYSTQSNTDLEINSICSIMNRFIEKCSEPLHFESQEALLKSLAINIRKMLGEEE